MSGVIGLVLGLLFGGAAAAGVLAFAEQRNQKVRGLDGGNGRPPEPTPTPPVENLDSLFGPTSWPREAKMTADGVEQLIGRAHWQAIEQGAGGDGTWSWAWRIYRVTEVPGDASSSFLGYTGVGAVTRQGTRTWKIDYRPKAAAVNPEKIASKSDVASELAVWFEKETGTRILVG